MIHNHIKLKYTDCIIYTVCIEHNLVTSMTFYCCISQLVSCRVVSDCKSDYLLFNYTTNFVGPFLLVNLCRGAYNCDFIVAFELACNLLDLFI